MKKSNASFMFLIVVVFFVVGLVYLSIGIADYAPMNDEKIMTFFEGTDYSKLKEKNHIETDIRMCSAIVKETVSDVYILSPIVSKQDFDDGNVVSKYALVKLKHSDIYGTSDLGDGMWMKRSILDTLQENTALWMEKAYSGEYLEPAEVLPNFIHLSGITRNISSKDKKMLLENIQKTGLSVAEVDSMVFPMILEYKTSAKKNSYTFMAIMNFVLGIFMFFAAKVQIEAEANRPNPEDLVDNRITQKKEEPEHDDLDDIVFDSPLLNSMRTSTSSTTQQTVASSQGASAVQVPQMPQMAGTSQAPQSLPMSNASGPQQTTQPLTLSKTTQTQQAPQMAGTSQAPQPLPMSNASQAPQMAGTSQAPQPLPMSNASGPQQTTQSLTLSKTTQTQQAPQMAGTSIAPQPLPMSNTPQAPQMAGTSRAPQPLPMSNAPQIGEPNPILSSDSGNMQNIPKSETRVGAQNPMLGDSRMQNAHSSINSSNMIQQARGANPINVPDLAGAPNSTNATGFGVAPNLANATGFGVAPNSANAPGFGVAPNSANVPGFGVAPNSANATGFAGVQNTFNSVPQVGAPNPLLAGNNNVQAGQNTASQVGAPNPLLGGGSMNASNNSNGKTVFSVLQPQNPTMSVSFEEPKNNK